MRQNTLQRNVSLFGQQISTTLFLLSYLKIGSFRGNFSFGKKKRKKEKKKEMIIMGRWLTFVLFFHGFTSCVGHRGNTYGSLLLKALALTYHPPFSNISFFFFFLLNNKIIVELVFKGGVFITSRVCGGGFVS